MVFVAIVIPVAVRGITIANRAGVFADRIRIATQLADKKLTEISVTNEREYGGRQGSFGEEWPGYRWRLYETTWEIDSNLRLLTIEVFFQVQDREESVHLSTLIGEADE